MKRSIYDYFVSKVKPKVCFNEPNDSDIPVPISTVPHRDKQNIIFSTPVSKNDSIFDIKLYIDKQLSKTEKIQALNTIWTPGKNHNFPITQNGSKNLKFQISWFEK